MVAKAVVLGEPVFRITSDSIPSDGGVRSMTRRIVLLAMAFALTAVASGPGEDDWKEGIRHFSAEDFRAAQDAFQQAVEQNPENSTYSLWLALAMGRRAERMTGFRKLAAAPLVRRMRRVFERSIELDESNLDAHDALQGFHLQAPSFVGGNKAEAREIARRIQAVNEARGAEAFGTYYEAVGEFDRADQQFGEARKLDPEGMRPLLKHAGFLARRGRHAESDDLFDLAFARDSEDPKVWRAAATAWVLAKRKSRYPEARELIERYLQAPDREPNPDPKSEVRDLLKRL